MSPCRSPRKSGAPSPPGDARELCASGDRHLGNGALAAAIRDYRRALEIDPDHARAHHNLGVAYYKLGQFGAAAREIDRAIELAPDAAEFRFTRGLVHKDSRQRQEALRCFDEALARSPGWVQALRYRGTVYFDLGDHDAAIADFERALELSPEEPGVAYDLAIAHADARHWGPAERWFLKAAEQDPDNVDVYYNLGLAHARDVSTPDSEAEAAFRRVLELDPHHLGARFQLGVLYAKAKYRDPAARQRAIDELKALTEAPELSRAFPEAHAAWFALGTLYDDQPETLAEAASCYARSLELKPDFAPALNNLGILLQRDGRAEEAADYFRRAIEADPVYASAYHNFCGLCYDQPNELLQQQLGQLIDEASPGLVDILLRLVLEFVDTARASAYEDTYEKVHEVKNLIAILGARMRTVQREVGQNDGVEPAREELSQLLSVHERTFNALRALLGALQTEEPRFEIVNMHQVVERGILEARARQPRDVAVAFVEGEAIPEIRGDAPRLGEAVSNLVYNAFEALEPSGGEVRIVVEALASSSAAGRILPAQGVRVVVSDNGPGMGPLERQRALRPGFTTKPGGSGYGLAVAAQVVRRHNGTLSISSAPGEGTTVTIELPLNLDVQKDQSRMRLRPVILEDSKRLIQTEVEGF
jgi:tetratricopeptide (TPR) repeat protein/anti-sigma regulatory factor (Ser/Thr protein kinase)